ncbi:hypothetical protein C8J57DRAFT_1258538 [Mycena rebaudengoi]|nr:hypothetical protein C8J57DRAFT_1258538 [Mycena rebaudengoi]
MPFMVTLALGLLVICVGLVPLHLSKREQQEELEKTRELDRYSALLTGLPLIFTRKARLCGEFWRPGILSESMQDVVRREKKNETTLKEDSPTPQGSLGITLEGIMRPGGRD